MRGGGEVLIGTDLGPAEVAELDVQGHRDRPCRWRSVLRGKFVARSLGIPMVIGVGGDLLSVTSGTDV